MLPIIKKTYTVISPDGNEYPATKWGAACQVAADIAKRYGNAEIVVKLTKDEQCQPAN